MDAMKYNDLRDFLTLLEQQGELKRITLPIPSWSERRAFLEPGIH